MYRSYWFSELVVVFFSCLIGTGATDQRTAQTTSSVGLRTVSTDISGNFRGEPLTDSSPLDRMIKEQMTKITTLLGFQIPICATDGQGTKSYPGAGIGVDRVELEAFRQKSQIHEFREMLRFLLAHESAHQLQFSKLGVEALTSARGEDSRLYECQADILGGVYLVQTMEKADDAEREAINDILQLTFDIGSTESSVQDYPSHEERRTAARLGIEYAEMKAGRSFPLGGNSNDFRYSLDVRGVETDFAWSFRMAKKVIHYRRKFSGGLVLDEGNMIVNWNTSSANPYVSFQLPYTNLGDLAIKVDMDVQTVIAPKYNSSETKRWLPGGTKHFVFTLQPKAKYVVSGSMRWYVYGDEKPRLVYPPDDTSLFTCEPAASAQRSGHSWPRDNLILVAGDGCWPGAGRAASYGVKPRHERNPSCSSPCPPR